MRFTVMTVLAAAYMCRTRFALVCIATKERVMQLSSKRFQDFGILTQISSFFFFVFSLEK